jgi:negative regulator of sigma E activity
MQVIESAKHLNILFFAISMALCGSLPAKAETPEGPVKMEVLKRIMNPPENLSFKGTEIQILIGKDGVPVVKKFTVEQKGGEFSRTKAGENAQPDEIYIKNQHGSWIYYPQQEKLVKREHANDADENFSSWNEEKLKKIQDNYEVKHIKDTTIAGRPCSVYSFRPKEKGRLFREFWVDTQSGLPLRIDTYSPDGRLLNLASFEAIEFNPEFPQDFSKAHFMEQATKGAQQNVLDVILVPTEKLQETLKSKVQFPGYVPKGYSLKNVFAQKMERGERYQLIYSDGMAPLSIFQEVTEGGLRPEEFADLEAVPIGKDGDGYFKQKGLIKILCFTAGKNRQTIIGEIEKNEILKIAESFYTTTGGTEK